MFIRNINAAVASLGTPLLHYPKKNMLHQCSAPFLRITESQSGWGWQWCLEVIWSSLLLKQGHLLQVAQVHGQEDLRFLRSDVVSRHSGISLPPTLALWFEFWFFRLLKQYKHWCPPPSSASHRWVFINTQRSINGIHHLRKSWCI